MLLRLESTTLAYLCAMLMLACQAEARGTSQASPKVRGTRFDEMATHPAVGCWQVTAVDSTFPLTPGLRLQFDTIPLFALHETTFADYVVYFRFVAEGQVLEDELPPSSSWIPWGEDSIRFGWTTDSLSFGFKARVSVDSILAVGQLHDTVDSDMTLRAVLTDTARIQHPVRAVRTPCPAAMR
jgi:hypothetical protein